MYTTTNTVQLWLCKHFLIFMVFALKKNCVWGVCVYARKLCALVCLSHDESEDNFIEFVLCLPFCGLRNQTQAARLA